MTEQNMPSDNIQEFLDRDEKKDLLRFLTAGSVDDGKSTLIGRLLFDSKKLYEDQLDALKRESVKEGHAGGEIDYALLLDGLKAEREQGITIDVAYRYFSTNRRKFIIADTPGHEQYTRNMITGGSTANLAIILLDAQKGVITQTKRHTYLISLLGIKHVVLAVNKMDLVNYDQERFDSICADYRAFITKLDIPDVDFIPISALNGDNVVDLSTRMPWYHGTSVLEFLETVHVSSDNNYDDFRFPVQYVLRPDLDFRGFSGKISSGLIHKGDPVIALPSRKSSKVKSIITYEGDLEEAFTPQGITLTLEDEIDISRGEMLVHPDNLPRLERHFEAMLVWMNEEALDLSTHFYIKHTTQVTRARIDKIRYKVDVNTLKKSEVEQLKLNGIGRVIITTTKPLFFDPYRRNRQTGSFILIDPLTNNTSAVGMIIDKLDPGDLPSKITMEAKQKIERGQGLIDRTEYIRRYNQKAATIWITGLHGSGKNALAYSLEKTLFDLGATVVLIDGFTIRSGLSRELDFSPSDRAEHLRRVAHICKILNSQGIITICSFISPDEDIRQQVKEIIGEDSFHLVYMDSDLEYSQKNKPELYKLSDEGKVSGLPGVDIPYEKPDNPNLMCQPDGENLEIITSYLAEKKIFPAT
ncbi:MAG: sulfate adenylyltransferase subunit CysN [Bacteroidota bacterium]